MDDLIKLKTLLLSLPSADSLDKVKTNDALGMVSFSDTLKSKKKKLPELNNEAACFHPNQQNPLPILLNPVESEAKTPYIPIADKETAIRITISQFLNRPANQSTGLHSRTVEPQPTAASPDGPQTGTEAPSQPAGKFITELVPSKGVENSPVIPADEKATVQPRNNTPQPKGSSPDGLKSKVEAKGSVGTDIQQAVRTDQTPALSQAAPAAKAVSPAKNGMEVFSLPVPDHEVTKQIKQEAPAQGTAQPAANIMTQPVSANGEESNPTISLDEKAGVQPGGDLPQRTAATPEVHPSEVEAVGSADSSSPQVVRSAQTPAKSQPVELFIPEQVSVNGVVSDPVTSTGEKAAVQSKGDLPQPTAAAPDSLQSRVEAKGSADTGRPQAVRSAQTPATSQPAPASTAVISRENEAESPSLPVSNHEPTLQGKQAALDSQPAQPAAKSTSDQVSTDALNPKADISANETKGKPSSVAGSQPKAVSLEDFSDLPAAAISNQSDNKRMTSKQLDPQFMVEVSKQTEIGQESINQVKEPAQLTPMKAGVVAETQAAFTAPLGSTQISDSVIQQITRQMEAAVRQNRTPIMVQLHPQELGQINIRMVNSQDGLRVVLSAAQASTGKLLETHLNQLRTTLAEAGIQISQVSINSTSQGLSQHDTLAQQEQSKPTRRNMPALENDAKADNQASSTIETRYSIIDYKV